MFEISFAWICGLVFGLEHHDGNDVAPDEVYWGITLDCGIFRVALIKWKEE